MCQTCHRIILDSSVTLGESDDTNGRIYIYSSISDRPCHQSVDAVSLLSADEVAQLPYTVLSRDSPVRARAERAASSYTHTVTSAASFAQVASQPVQVTSSRGASAEGTPERGPSRTGFDLRDTLSRSVVPANLQVAIATTVAGRLVTIADSSGMDPPPDPVSDSFRVVSPVPSVSGSQTLLVEREVSAGEISYIPLR